MAGVIEPHTVTAPRSSTPPDDATDIGGLVDFLKRYVQQETLGPLQGVGRWLGMGVAGAAVLGLGLCILLLGLLRVIQTEWERSATGSLSWLPYVIVLLVAVGLIALAVSRINRTSLNKEPE